MKTSKRGFTLVELLVVIAIIGILAGMLVPILLNSLETGRQAACKNNIKQLKDMDMQLQANMTYGGKSVSMLPIRDLSPFNGIEDKDGVAIPEGPDSQEGAIRKSADDAMMVWEMIYHQNQGTNARLFQCPSASPVEFKPEDEDGTKYTLSGVAKDKDGVVTGSTYTKDAVGPYKRISYVYSAGRSKGALSTPSVMIISDKFRGPDGDLAAASLKDKSGSDLEVEEQQSVNHAGNGWNVANSSGEVTWQTVSDFMTGDDPPSGNSPPGSAPSEEGGKFKYTFVGNWDKGFGDVVVKDDDKIFYPSVTTGRPGRVAFW